MEPAAGAAPAFVGPAYEPMLKIEAGGEQAYAYVAPKEPSDWGTVEEIRALVGKSGDYFASQEAYTKYQEFCAVTKIEDVGGKEFHELAEITYAYIHRPKGGSTGGPCMVYFHGGMQIAGGPEQSTHFLNRYVAEANITIISVKYRLAPEARTPCQIADGFAAFVDVVTNPAKFGIDATKVGFFGDSTGAYIAAGVGMVRVRSTGNLLENPDVVLHQCSLGAAPRCRLCKQCSLGAAACCLLFMLTAALLIGAGPCRTRAGPPCPHADAVEPGHQQLHP